MSSRVPFMPDWPVLRHLTWREAHMLELGAPFGAAFALAAHLGSPWAAVALVALLFRRMQSGDQHRSGDDLVRGYLRDAWYMVAGAALTAVAVTLMLGWPS